MVSIKLYEAYRVARGVDPFDLLWEIKRRGQREARARLKQLYRDILDGKAHREALRLEAKNLAFRSWLEDEGHTTRKPSELLRLLKEWSETEMPEELAGPVECLLAVRNDEILAAIGRTAVEGAKPGVFDIDTWVQQKYGEQLTTFVRNPWALDVSVTMRRYRKRYYLVPYCERSSFVGGSLDFLPEMEGLEEFGYWNNTDRPDHVTAAQWAWRGRVWEYLTQHDVWPEFVCIDIVSWHGWAQVSPMMKLAHEYGVS